MKNLKTIAFNLFKSDKDDLFTLDLKNSFLNGMMFQNITIKI